MKNTTNQQRTIFDTVPEKDKIKALQYGFNLSKLAAFIDTICEKFTDGEKVNSIDLNDNYIWLYVYDPTTGKTNYYDIQVKYNNCKGWAIPDGLKEKKEKNILSNLIKAASISADFKKTNKPKDGYFIKELENNKPTTLLKAKDNNFINFVVFSQYGKINEIDITEEKREFEKEFFNINNNYWDAKTIRKNALKVFAVYNKQMPQYKELCKVIASKRAERTKNTTQKETKKYFYTDKSVFDDLLITTNNLHFYNFSYHSLLKHEFDKVEGGLIVKCGGEEFLRTTEPTTRQKVFNFCVDKSGYCVIFYREKMQRRLYTLKAERARARAEKEREEWKASDKTELKNKVNRMLNYLLTEITKRSLFDDNSFEELKKYRELYKRFEKQLNFDNYNSVSDWQKYFDEKIKDFNFYDRAIKKGLLDRVACVHHYEKQMDGSYKNISKDSFFKDASRYVQEF